VKPRKDSKWSDRDKKVVRGVHGTIVGTAVIYMAYKFAGLLLADGNLTITEALFIGGLAACGFVASMPWIFMPMMHRIIDAYQSRRR